MALVALACTLVAAEAPPIEVKADRGSYRAGETALLTLWTHAGGPSDVYIILTTPAGRKLYADRNLQFRRSPVAAARNFALAEGKVEIPVSLATSELARPGRYSVEIYVTDPGQPARVGDLAGSANFLVTIPGLNFMAIHDPGSPKYDPECEACHVDKTRPVFLAPGIPSFHAIKYKMFSAGGVEHPCTICHQGADLIDQSQAALRKQASPDLCARCHGGLGTGKRLFAK